MEINATHHGKMFGVPVWLDMTDPECPGVEAKYKLDLVLDFMESMFALYCFTVSLINPEFEPMFLVQVGEEINNTSR